MHINLTLVEQSMARLVDEQQDVVVISAQHPLADHKALLAALWKARRTKTEPAATQGARPCGRRACACHPCPPRLVCRKQPRQSRCPQPPGPPPLVSPAAGSHAGYHSLSHSAIDAEQLMEELALAADTLTHGLTGAAHAMSKEDSHPLEQLRHEGTRVVPVFVISLMQAPDDIIFANREMVAASHDAVVVLQLRQRCSAAELALGVLPAPATQGGGGTTTTGAKQRPGDTWRAR